MAPRPLFPQQGQITQTEVPPPAGAQAQAGTGGKPSARQMSAFETAFFAARKSGAKTFDFRGKSYTTALKASNHATGKPASTAGAGGKTPPVPKAKPQAAGDGTSTGQAAGAAKVPLPGAKGSRGAYQGAPFAGPQFDETMPNPSYAGNMPSGQQPPVSALRLSSPDTIQGRRDKRTPSDYWPVDAQERAMMAQTPTPGAPGSRGSYREAPYQGGMPVIDLSGEEDYVPGRARLPSLG